MASPPLAGYEVRLTATRDSAAALACDLLVELGACIVENATPDIWVLDAGAMEVHGGETALRSAADGDGGPVVTVVTPFGLTGPLSDAPGSELTIQALAGILLANGNANDPPVQIGVPAARCAAALLSLTAIAAALLERQRSGRGQLIDIAEYDCLVNLCGTLFPTYFLTHKPFRRIGNRHAMSAPWNAYRTTDGWVVISTMGETQWRAVLGVIDRLDLIDDQRFTNAESRVANVDDLDTVIEQWTMRYSTEYVQGRMQDAGIPISPVRTLAEALEDPQVNARELVLDRESELAPGRLFRIRQSGGSGAHPPLSQVSASDRVRSAPLVGLRIIEISSYTAGPLAGRLLGQLGAEVIKIEPPGGEGSRHLAQRQNGTGYLHFVNNTDKSGVVLDLSTAEGVGAYHALVSNSDVVLTNLAAETLDRLGIDHKATTEKHPRVIFTSITGFGLTGPSAQLKAFDTVVQAAGGIMSLTGFADQAPLKAAVSVADTFAACAAAAGTIIAILRRERDGIGQVVDAAMFDATLWLTQSLWPPQKGGKFPSRIGNESREHAPHNVYPTLAGEEWVAIAVMDDEQWAGIVKVLGDQLPAELRIPSIDRMAHRADIDKAIEQWTSKRRPERIVAALLDAGVPAARANSLEGVVKHPQTIARGLVIPQEDEVNGRLWVIGTPFRFSGTPVRVRRRAPHLGEHNEGILGAITGEDGQC